MKRLTLLRHAKSSWANSEQQDFDRALNNRGLHDAPAMSQRLLDKQCTPDLILCSAANRTRQTAQFFVDIHGLSSTAITFHEDLYLASAGTLLDFIQQTNDSVNHLMVIAHNPGLEVLGCQLHPDSPSSLATCAVLDFSLHSDSFTIQPDTQIELLLHDFPKNTAS